MADRIVTVVGGTGFLGRYVIRELAERGYIIRVLARDVEAHTEIKTFGDVGQIVIESADLSRPETLEGKLANSYAVVNLVGVLFERRKQNFALLHAQGPEKLAQMATACGAARFVQVSSLGVEKAITSKYARTKLLGEKAAVAAFPDTTIIRPGVMFGPEDDFFNKFAWMATFSPILPLIGGGHTLFQPVYVADVARAIAQAVDDPATIGKIYELGGPETLSFKDILSFILEATGRHAMLMNLPFALASMKAFFWEFLPTPILTRDQIRLLHYDNVVGNDALTFADLGIRPTGIDTVVPSYLQRFKKHQPQERLAS